MALDAKQQKILLKSTKTAAAAFVEDMHHFRSIFQSPDDLRGNLRRASVSLRRLLVHQEITAIAAPRMTGRLHFNAIDNSGFVANGSELYFFATGGFDLLNIFDPYFLSNSDAKKPSSLPILSLTLDAFLQQELICLNGKWARRVAIIKYVANYLSGAHTGQPILPTEETERLIERMRHGAFCWIENGRPYMEVNQDAVDPNVKEFEVDYSRKRFDAVSLEILSTIFQVVTSSEVAALEDEVKKELSIT